MAFYRCLLSIFITGLFGNIIVSIIGAILGGFAFGLLGIPASGMIGSINTATVGAALLLFLIRLIRKTQALQSIRKSSMHCKGCFNNLFSNNARKPG
jgi:uncharacterized membrane protein YeaQ/YmgE (transglycosylase-associated protein family)